MLTLSQNGGNRVSDDFKFQDFPGEDAIEPSLLKTWIRTRSLTVISASPHNLFRTM